MLLLKKLIFSLPFLLSLYLSLVQLQPFLKNYQLIFSLDSNVLVKIIVLISCLILSGFFFIVFASLANDWKLVGPIILLGLLLPLLVLPINLSLILAVGLLVSLSLIFALLQNGLKKYINFEPNHLLGPSIKNLVSLIIIFISIIFYFSISTEIKTNGFKLPDALIDTALKFSPEADTTTETPSNVKLPSLSKEQISLLKQNPELLKQYGIDPSVLDSLPDLNQPQKTNTTKSSPVKQLVQAQFQKMINPYLAFIPVILAFLFYFSLQSIFSILSVLLPLFIYAIFWILEKTNFIHFEAEMREVKKMVV